MPPFAREALCPNMLHSERMPQRLRQLQPRRACLQRIPRRVLNAKNRMELERHAMLGELLMHRGAAVYVRACAFMENENEFPGEHSDERDSLSNERAFRTELRFYRRREFF